jgi:hypothetical protein
MRPLKLDRVSLNFPDLDISASLPNPDPDLIIPDNALDCQREINMSVIIKRESEQQSYNKIIVPLQHNYQSKVASTLELQLQGSPYASFHVAPFLEQISVLHVSSPTRIMEETGS